LSGNVKKAICAYGIGKLSKMSSGKKLVLIDDDVELCVMLSEYLSLEGFHIEAIHTGVAGLDALGSGSFDLAILDVMLPGLGGIEVLRQARTTSSIPIIMLTARGTASDRISGLELGADDYLPKPFDPRELLARINAILRRKTSDHVSTEIRVEDLRLVPGNRSVFVNGEAINLTSIEYDLLLMLVKKAGKAISRDDLATVLGRRLLPFDRTIDMHVVNLRKKLGRFADGNHRILTVRSSGYMLALQGRPA
jgi:two-component system response regulator CpxR